MPKKSAELLLSHLHDRFSGDAASPQIKQLMENMQAHLHNWGEEEPADPSFKEMVEMLLLDIESNHPKEAKIIESIVNTLSNMGI